MSRAALEIVESAAVIAPLWFTGDPSLWGLDGFGSFRGHSPAQPYRAGPRSPVSRRGICQVGSEMGPKDPALARVSEGARSEGARSEGARSEGARSEGARSGGAVPDRTRPTLGTVQP